MSKYDLSTLRLVKRWKERLQIPRDESERCAYGTRLQCCVAELRAVYYSGAVLLVRAVPVLSLPCGVHGAVYATSIRTSLSMISLGAHLSMVRTLVGMSIP